MISSNYLSLWSLFKKEVLRFLKVGIQTIVGPAVSSLLFLAVFSLALGKSVQSINGINFSNFIAPGLIMMTMLQNSFANAASSIGQAKSQGNIVDILMAPLNDIELATGIGEKYKNMELLFFSMKESVIKVLSPLLQEYVEFKDIEIKFDDQVGKVNFRTEYLNIDLSWICHGQYAITMAIMKI